MEECRTFIVDYAAKHGPVTVRQLYYLADVVSVPGIDKTDDGFQQTCRTRREQRRQRYKKVQSQVLWLGRNSRMPYQDIADATRWMRKPSSWSNVEDALNETPRLYRKRLWDELPDRVEIWCEKDALAGVIYPITAQYDVPLMVARGFSSETFCFEAVEAYDEDKTTYVYYLGDFDRSGVDAARSLHEKLERFAAERGIAVEFETIAITRDQIRRFALPTREPKRIAAADRRWPYAFACELDAMAPDDLRALVENVINRHLPQDQLDVLKAAEQSEREVIQRFVRSRS
jgi:hypothetical protein